MKYLAFAMKLAIILIGVGILVCSKHEQMHSHSCMVGIAIILIGLYLALDGYFGKSFSGCIFKKETPKKAEKKGLFGFKK